MLLSIAWKMIRGQAEKWVETRALHLPKAKVAEISKRFGVGEEVVGAINDEVAKTVFDLIDKAASGKK